MRGSPFPRCADALKRTLDGGSREPLAGALRKRDLKVREARGCEGQLNESS